MRVCSIVNNTNKMLFNQQQQRSLQSANSGLSLKKNFKNNARRNYSTEMSADLSPIDKKQNAKLKGDLNC